MFTFEKNSMSKIWTKLPVVLRAILSGLAVTLSLIVPWGVLYQANIRSTLNTPWCVAVIGVYLVFWWKIVSKYFRINTGNDLVNITKTKNPVPYTVWGWSFLAGSLVTAALYIMLLLTMQVFKLDTTKTFDFSKITFVPFIVYALAASLVASLAEEAGYRGYMQSTLLNKYNFIYAATIVAVVFSISHLLNSGSIYFTGIYIIASANYSFLTKATKSILPAIILHFLIDFLSYCSIWATRGNAASGGLNVSFWLIVAVLLIAAATVVAYLKIFRRSLLVSVK